MSKHGMGNIFAKIPNDTDEEFRKVVSLKFGLKKGVIEKAILEAIKDWIEKNTSDGSQ